MLLKILNYLGYAKILFKADQAPALVKLVEHVRDHKGEDIVRLVWNTALFTTHKHTDSPNVLYNL